MADRSSAQVVADVVVWLDHATTMEILRLLLQNEPARAFARLLQVAPDLDPDLARDSEFLERLLDELELRVSPSDDPDDLETREVPDYTRFAREQPTDEKPRR